MEMHETEPQRPEEQELAIYSKLAVLLFSIFFSPLIGGVLLMLNLRSAGYKKEGTRVLLFAIAYQLLSSVAVSYVAQLMRIKPDDPAMLKNTQVIVSLIILNIIGGGILAEYFFKKYFPDNDYQHKSIWKALLITLLISIPLSMLMRI